MIHAKSIDAMNKKNGITNNDIIRCTEYPTRLSSHALIGIKLPNYGGATPKLPTMDQQERKLY